MAYFLILYPLLLLQNYQSDYNQLKPVNDRISIYTDYANNPYLFDLADYDKIQLTKCRRADDKL